jgi:DNA-binding NarL/FixJ family response regulator
MSILIVDDDPGFGRAAAELLTGRGYRVLGQATTVAQALEECARLDPHAVLVDLRLPDGDGVELAAKLHARQHPPKILLTSTDAGGVPVDRWKQSGALGFIPKTELAETDLESFFGA